VSALALAAAIEGDSEHIIGRAIVAAAQERGLTLPKVDTFEALPGRGVQATVDGQLFQAGGPRLLEQAGLTLPAALGAQTRDWGGRGQTVLEGRQVRAAFALADVIRPESREAIAALKQQGIQMAMLTGDSEDVARWVASELGIETYLRIADHSVDLIVSNPPYF
jgi:Cu2+-exporting ATPase